jgi:hypothetical protein
MSLLGNWFPKKAHDKTRPAEIGRSRQAVNAELSKSAHSRRQQRMERRALLYAVVREAMACAGVLSTGYSFKVLSLEPLGRQYFIMVDCSRELAQETRQQSDIEKQIILNARAQHDIAVLAIYWRVNERQKGMARRTAMSSQPGLSHRFEPIGEDEVAALRQALAVGMAAAQPSGFEDTELMVAKDPCPALSRTQYGDLN